MKVYYNGCLFESMIELKYALSIEDEYAYILHPKRIFDSFYRDNGKIVEIYEHTKSYTPDFFIRSYSENIAYIIEIKPHGFSDQQQYEKRNSIMQRYLQSLDHPVVFEWVFWKDEKLPEEKMKKFHDVIGNQASEKKFYELIESMFNHNTRVPYSFPNGMSDPEYVKFLLHGENPNL